MRRALLILASFLFAPAAGAELGIVFVVNKENPVTELTMNDVSDYYFKRRTRWANGAKIQFIDQRDGSARKESFLTLIGRSQRDLDLFWIGEKNFSGQSAPLQAPSDTMVLSMVGSLAGAIGYVGADRAATDKVKLITVKKSE